MYAIHYLLLVHILLLLVILLVFFGPSRLPQLGSSIGRAIRGFKEGLNEIDGEARDLGAKNAKNDENQQLRQQQQQQAKTDQPQHETSDLKKS